MTKMVKYRARYMNTYADVCVSRKCNELCVS